MKNKQIIHTISGMDAKSGGPTTATRDLLRAMNLRGDMVHLVTFYPLQKEDKVVSDNEGWITYLPEDRLTPIGFSRNLKKYLDNTSFDLLHTNGLWLYANHITCLMARKQRRPYIITPHGMLNPLALKRSYWKKKLVQKVWFDKDIKMATCIHATCKEEMEDIRAFGYNGHIAIIPNPVSSYSCAVQLFEDKKKQLLKGKTLKFGFLGRIHPVKKIENLIYGLSLIKCNKDCCELVIMGDGDYEYEKFLKNEVKRLGLKNVNFLGFVTGDEKYRRLAELTALFVPSDFENFGMIVTESLTVGTPVMASLGTPWKILNTEKCGWWVDRKPETIANVMNNLLLMSPKELINMGERGMNLVHKEYSDEIVASKMSTLYTWILEGGKKPNFVF